MILIYQDYIAPIFDKYSPLEEGELYDSIKQLALKIKFPLKRILVLDGSKRSSHSNAYFIGLFGKKTIVLYDTLFKNTNEKTQGDDKEQVYFILINLFCLVVL